jgi:hypothetical protein
MSTQNSNISAVSTKTSTTTTTNDGMPTSTQLPATPQTAAPSSITTALAEYLIKAGRLRTPNQNEPGSAGTHGTAGSYGFGESFANQDVNKILGEYMSFNEREGDVLFEKYGPGNTLNVNDRPFERAQAYEQFLKILHEYNPAQFLKIHKGTPYYFVGWTAFQFMDYSKALFYLDAAMSDDLKFPEVQNQTQTRPAVDFFLLKDSSPATGFSMHQKLNSAFAAHLNEFNTRSGLAIAKNDFVEKFIKPLLYSNGKNRALLTALYTFLLNHEKRITEIRLRSHTGGSINTFIDELFDGARLLESLLEAAGGGTGTTLGRKINNLPILMLTPGIMASNQTLADAEIKFDTLKAGGSHFQDCVFAASYIIRNTTGHSLIWNDQFVNQNSYSKLYTCLIESIFWTAYKCWIE